MSLDVYLIAKEPTVKSGTGVFVREDGQNRELTAAEVKEKWPNAEVTEEKYETNIVFEYNITHNLSSMAALAGIYEELWCPGEKGITKAKQLIKPLARGLKYLIDNPVYFKSHNPENGWGTYDNMILFVEAYLEKCKEYPKAKVMVSR